MTPELIQVRVFLIWLECERRLLLLRTIDYVDRGIGEMWWSRPVVEQEVMNAGPILDPVQWQRLWSGLPAGRFDLRIPFFRISNQDDSRGLESVARFHNDPTSHVLTSVRSIVRHDLRGAEVLAIGQSTPSTHPIAHALDFSIDHTPESFAQLLAEAPPVRARYEVALSDARGIMIGDDNRQINRFDITVRDAEFDLSKVLARPRVQEAIAAVTMEPGDAQRRAELVEALAHPGLFVSWHPARLTVTDPGAKESAGFISTLLGINVDVMVGDGNRQTNRFTYVASRLPEAQDLLAGNEELAQAVAGLICPTDAGASPAELLSVVNDAVGELSVDFTNDRVQAVTMTPYPGMCLSRIDGAMLGEDLLQENTIRITPELAAPDLDQFFRSVESWSVPQPEVESPFSRFGWHEPEPEPPVEIRHPGLPGLPGPGRNFGLSFF